ncbi:hypothetical protein AAFF_G00263070 [Aldrovandia affinis]|uniref:Uncharacterized protein n=1 Tax=Aldrovandia affinis TaxID=143900 RepID=A0AAD7SSQ3_9TELE|nr:hypothetical protein AAFF_G00263070 [Aldrovandia affinis]
MEVQTVMRASAPGRARKHTQFSPESCFIIVGMFPHSSPPLPPAAAPAFECHRGIDPLNINAPALLHHHEERTGWVHGHASRPRSRAAAH